MADPGPAHVGPPPKFQFGIFCDEGESILGTATHVVIEGPRVGTGRPMDAAAAAAAVDAAAAAAIDAALTKMMTENVNTPLRVVGPELVENAVKVLTKVLANIVAEPGEEKFRRLKKANKMVQGKLLPCRGAVQLLMAVGFRNVDEVFVLADERRDLAALNYALQRLGGLGEEKEAAAAAEAAAAEQARRALYLQQQADREEDKRVKLIERKKLDEQRAEFARRAASDSAPWEAPDAAAAASSPPPAEIAAAAAAAESRVGGGTAAAEQSAAPQSETPASAAEPADDAASGSDREFGEGDRVIYRGTDGPEVVTIVSISTMDLEPGEEPMVAVRMTSGVVRDTVLAKLEHRPT